MCITSTLGPHCSGEAYLEQLSGPKEYKARLVRVFSLESKSSVLGTSSPARPDAWKVQEGQSPASGSSGFVLSALPASVPLPLASAHKRR